jgi:hypothetical protein
LYEKSYKNNGIVAKVVLSCMKNRTKASDLAPQWFELYEKSYKSIGSVPAAGLVVRFFVQNMGWTIEANCVV